MASTLKINNLDTASGSTITIPTGKQLIVTDEGAVRVPGTVLQTIYVVNGTAQNSIGAGNVDTGLQATITPKSTSSKVLIIASHHFRLFAQNSDAGVGFRIMRGSTVAYTYNTTYRNYLYSGVSGSALEFRGSDTIMHLDSPSTTSATVYKTQAAKYNVAINLQSDSNKSSMVLMEIAQ